MTDYTTWFRDATAESGRGHDPWPWQQRLAGDPTCRNRLIRIPTGLGKTLGVLGTWLYHRHVLCDPSWPLRLAWCLPMRTLTEQTRREAEAMIARCGLSDQVGVHTLMGGEDAGDWMNHPDRSAMLIGTQDMLLSAALNRGYGTGRAAWPRAMGVLNVDCLWVADEVQLMDVGLATTGQLQAFFDQPGHADSPPRRTWWMSATLQPDWLLTPETQSQLPALVDDLLDTTEDERTGSTWTAKKPLRLEEGPHDAATLAATTLREHERHAAAANGTRQTLLVVNRVTEAQEVFRRIQKAAPAGTSAHLLHSRFRPHERSDWSSNLLQKARPDEVVNRILVATQVVEAGVDISATCLLTRLAPWPSLVQRFGRAARYGGSAEVIVFAELPTEKDALPYAATELEAALEALGGLEAVDLGSLINHEALMPDDALAALYPYQPEHVLIEREWEELFDTSADVAGDDLDVGRFIRSGEDRDVLVFWREGLFEPGNRSDPNADLQPSRRELCRVSITDARKWLETGDRAWIWDFGDGAWKRLGGSTRLRPGATVLVAAELGGYDAVVGFTGSRKSPAPVVPTEQPSTDRPPASDDRSDGSERLSASLASGEFQTIATHGLRAAKEGVKIATDLNLPESDRELLHLTMRLHDWGKAHPAFACCIRAEPPRSDLAKAPPEAWVSMQKMYRAGPDSGIGDRPRFRHELASALAVLCWLAENEPRHAAIRGCFEGSTPEGEDQTRPSVPGHEVLDEVRQLDENRLNLLLYLLASHHGKVRGSLLATEADRGFRPPKGTGASLPIRGVRTGDTLPATMLSARDGTASRAPAVQLDVDVAGLGLSVRFGRSWTDRVASLLRVHGPARLAWLEAIVRAADARASAWTDADPLLDGVQIRVMTTPTTEDVTGD